MIESAAEALKPKAMSCFREVAATNGIICRMRILVAFLGAATFIAPASAQVFNFADLNTRDFAKLDRAKTVLILPGGVIEEHGPYLPAGSDGIFNDRLAADLASFIASRPGWTAVLLPHLPLGTGAANEIGRKYSFDGSCTVRPATLRAVLMDIGDQLGALGFRWIFIVNGHGDPAHNRMLDQAGDYFHNTYARW